MIKESDILNEKDIKTLKKASKEVTFPLSEEEIGRASCRERV